MILKGNLFKGYDNANGEKMFIEENLENKYNMSLEENIFLAKRNMIDSVWKSANLEGIAVTYPETEIIFQGIAVENKYIRDINAIVNLKNAWKFILENIEYKVDLAYISKVHEYIGAANVIIHPGEFRTGQVSMGGTSWKPDIILDKNKIKENLEKILNINSATERAITMFLYLTRQQIFWDGNKRVATLICNQIMIQNGVGIISIPIEKQKEFKSKLITFYETNDYTPLKKYIYDHCIDGINFKINK